MSVVSHDILFIGMQHRSYISALESARKWEEKYIADARMSFCFCDTTFVGAATLLAMFPDVSIIYIANEAGMPRDIARAACRKWIDVLRDRQRKPVIVLHEDCLDLVDDFAEHGYQVDLRASDGTVEEALRALVAQ